MRYKNICNGCLQRPTKANLRDNQTPNGRLVRANPFQARNRPSVIAHSTTSAYLISTYHVLPPVPAQSTQAHFSRAFFATALADPRHKVNSQIF